MALNWYLNGINLKDYGITVSGSLGLVDGLKRKDPFKVDLPDYHGEIVDLEKTIYESRDITLNCWIKASGMLDFTTKVNTFNLALKGKGTNRFTVEIDPSKPLVYEVYFPDKTAIDKKWDYSTMVGTFSLKMRESEPIKRVFKYTETIGSNTYHSKTPLSFVGSPASYGTINNRLNNGFSVTTNKDTSFSELRLGNVIKGNGWYTISGYVKTNQDYKQKMNIQFNDVVVGYVDASSTEQYFAFSHKVTNYTSDIYKFVDIYMLGWLIYQFRDIKIEKGNKATAWTPSPNDSENDKEKLEITLNTDKLVNIHWGDGTHDYDIVGSSAKVSHSFEEAKSYFIIVSGVIEELKSLTGKNLVEVWNIL